MDAPPPEPVDLDRAATTPLGPEARAALAAAPAAGHGNPSARHALGVRARAVLDAARDDLARLLGAGDARVLWTSGATEANNLAVLGLARAQRRRGAHVLVGAAEHPSVSGPAAALAREGFEVETLPLEPDGSVDAARCAERLRPDTVLVTQLLVSNLWGAIAPVERLARAVRSRAPQARFHVDAVQALGRVPVDFTELGVDSLSLSAHKLHGPTGSGALLLARDVRLEPLWFGGGQQDGLRPGTESVAGALGLTAAAAAACARSTDREPLRARLLEAFRSALAPDTVTPLGPAAPAARTGAILSLRLPGPPAEVWMHHLAALGVWTSVGSACQARAGRLPAGYAALGLEPAAVRQVLRLSTSYATTADEIERAVERIGTCVERLRGLGLLSARVSASV